MQLRKSGFTLIELIMVVCIIGMMAIFVIPNYTKTVAKSYEKAAMNNLTIVFSAQKLKANNGANYQTAGNTAAVNTNLSLGIIENGVTYSCPFATGTTSFDCRATKGSFKIKVDQSTPTACCCDTFTCTVATTACGVGNCP